MYSDWISAFLRRIIAEFIRMNAFSEESGMVNSLRLRDSISNRLLVWSAVAVVDKGVYLDFNFF